MLFHIDAALISLIFFLLSKYALQIFNIQHIEYERHKFKYLYVHIVCVCVSAYTNTYTRQKEPMQLNCETFDKIYLFSPKLHTMTSTHEWIVSHSWHLIWFEFDLISVRRQKDDMQVNVAGIRRNIKNLAHNYSDPQVNTFDQSSS